VAALRVAVIGATGDVGRGITAVLLDRGHQVTGVARNTSRLETLRQYCGAPSTLDTLAGSIANDSDAAHLAAALRNRFERPDAIVVTVNAPRQPRPLLELRSDDYAALIGQDLISHFTAARAFVPLLAPNGVLLGIGGGSCDFVLQGGIPQSNAQAALRMLYRGLAEECRGCIHVRELIIASVVNGASNRHAAHPSWVTEREVGAQVAAMLEQPEQFANPIWRIARRDASGRPVVSDEGPSRVQGFDAAEATPLP
jgi:NAD(P)-dependent dehydrogenase (short-subunit alcohol dehydrogenase family)